MDTGRERVVLTSGVPERARNVRIGLPRRQPATVQRGGELTARLDRLVDELNTRPQLEPEPEPRPDGAELIAGGSYCYARRQVGYQNLPIDEKHMVVTRSFPPDLLLERPHLEGSRFIWLSSSMHELAAHPADLEQLNHSIKEFARSGQGYICIEGLDHLLTHNSFKGCLKWLQALRDLISVTRGRLLVHLPVGVFDEREYHQLAQGLEPL